MRGTVTLAATLALPTATAGGGAFPYRDLILVCAFGVVLGTLVIQGLTLPPLLSRLGLEDDGSVDREVRLARAEGLRAVDAMAAFSGGVEVELVRERFTLQLRRAQDEMRGDGDSRAAAGDGDAEVVRAAFEAMRSKLMELRRDETIGDAAFQRLEEELDWSELGWAQVGGSRCVKIRRGETLPRPCVHPTLPRTCRLLAGGPVRLRMLAFLLLPGAVACASSGQTSGEETGATVQATVINEYVGTVTAYAVWGTSRLRLGDIAGNRQRLFAIPLRGDRLAIGLEVIGAPPAATSAGPTRLRGGGVGDPDPSAPYTVSEAMPVVAGDAIEFRLSAARIFTVRRLQPGL